MNKRIVLASGSPRRKELLGELLDSFEVIPSGCEEIVPENVGPEEIVMSLARQKAEDVAKNHADAVVIGSDTIVYSDGEVMGKPQNEADAVRMLKKLSGTAHSVYTGVCILHNGQITTFCDKTEVEFYTLSEAEIADYIATNEPFDKAGAYGIQGKGAVLVKGIIGDFFNVMGLPIGQLDKYFKKLGIYEKRC